MATVTTAACVAAPPQSARAEPDVTASRCWYQVSARTRVVLHIDNAHFVLLEFDGCTSIHESNRHGEIGGDWYGLVVELNVDDALRSFAQIRQLSFDLLASLVAPFRRLDTQRAANEGALSAPPIQTAPAIFMGRSPLAFPSRNVASEDEVRPVRLVRAREADPAPPGGEGPSIERNATRPSVEPCHRLVAVAGGRKT
jgi:hypothetical protein